MAVMFVGGTDFLDEHKVNVAPEWLQDYMAYVRRLFVGQKEPTNVR
jgi:hypothetical protein